MGASVGGMYARVLNSNNLCLKCVVFFHVNVHVYFRMGKTGILSLLWEYGFYKPSKFSV